MQGRRFYILTLAVIVAVSVMIPSAVSAQGPTDYFPIVRCGTAENTDPCTPCDLFAAGDRVIRFILLGITGPIAAFMLVLAGGMFLLGADNPGLRVRAKSLLTRTVLGVTVILLSWTATNFLIKLLNSSIDTGPWYEYSCPDFLQDIGKTTPLPSPAASRGSPQQPSSDLIQAYKGVCTAQALAAQFKSASSIKIAPELTSLMQCLERDQVVKALIKDHPFTYDESHILCNYTHGIRTYCEPSCSHSQFSCHYGGMTGTDGAEAVDYAWNGKRVAYMISSRTVVNSCIDSKGKAISGCRVTGSREGLFEELYRAAQKNGCKYKLLNYEGNHVHISVPSCDKDGWGVKGAAVPSL